KQCAQAKEKAADRDVTGAINNAAGNGASGADGGDGVWMNLTPDQPVRDRIDDAQVSVFQPVRQNFHSVPSRRIATGPAGDTAIGVAVEPLPGRGSTQRAEGDTRRSRCDRAEARCLPRFGS